jgi:4-hydroxy 2-oxovalerate aldolase
MSKVSLLDCTLRDGGYVNDWRFGNLTMRSIIIRLDNAGVDIIECGFLDSRAEYDKSRSLFPDMPSIAQTLRDAVPKRALLVAMIDYGTFDRHLLVPKSESVLDGIRLIFKKDSIDAALDYAMHIKRLGYQLFLNPVAFPSYRTAELLGLIEKINAVKPCAMSIVDTYGLMFNHDLEKSVVIVDAELSQDIALGYHVHNNLEMANAHAISFISKNLSREIIVDSSVLGMGKNAGNARTEIVASFLDKTNHKQLDLNHILECAYTDIQKFMTLPNWGYGLDNFISAIHDCSPYWIKFLKQKNTLSIKGIRDILDNLPNEKGERSYFSETFAEQKYLDYMERHLNDETAIEELRAEIAGKSVLLLCPGKTLETHRAEITNFIDCQNPVVFTVNFITDLYRADFAFISNTSRYSLMLGKRSELAELPKLILTSNITVSAELAPDYVINLKTLYETMQSDNSTGLLINLLKIIGIAEVTVAGMDGYDEKSIGNSFFDPDMASVPKENANDIVTAQLKRITNVNITWLTPSIIKEALEK